MSAPVFIDKRREPDEDNNRATYKGYAYVDNVPGSLNLQVTEEGGQIRPFPTLLELNSFAQNAMLATMPTRTHAQVATALGELLADRKLPELMLSIVAHRGISKKTLSDEFLNYQFGILPFIGDIQKICEAVIDSNKIITDFINGSGKVSYRHWNNKASGLPDVELLTNVSQNESYIIATNRGLNGPARSVFSSGIGSYWGAKTSTLQNETRQWRFAGAWSYLLSKDSTFVGKMNRFEQLANNLLGTRITLDVLWNLAPWSWLADWFLDIGRFLQINSALQNDSLVLQFGYLTCITRQTTLNTLTFNGPDGHAIANANSFNTFFTCERKERIRATPYGFGLDTANLSGTQLAILAALGFSRGR